MAKKTAAAEGSGADAAVEPAPPASTPPASTPPASTPPANPFDVRQTPVVFMPVATPEAIAQLNERVKQIPASIAARLVEDIANETRRQRSATVIINTVFGLITGVVGALK